MTRGSITGQVKALSMIAAMQNFIPDRLAVTAGKNPPAPPARPQIYAAAWHAGQQATTTTPQPGPTPARQEDSPDVPEPELVPGSPEGATTAASPSHSTSSPHLSLSQSEPPASYVPSLTSVPDARVPFSINKNPFARLR